jgi:tRNA/tmRNA/rRNA uracil-C5-methylase (TrmA/RlmC/RlmD family)
VALVSCDPAAMGRDVALLAHRGLRLDGVQLVDQFAHTHHVEAVVSFIRSAQR